MTHTGVFLDRDGKYKAIEDEEIEFTVQELIHSTYGAINYIVYSGDNVAVFWDEDSYNKLPVDWVEELA